MKIAVVTPYFPLRDQPYRGHSAYQTLLRLKRWADVEALCPLTTYPSWFMPRNFPYSRTDLSYSPPGIPTTYFEYPALPGITRPLNGAICASYLERRLEKLKADVILNYWIYPEGYAAVVAGSKLGIPVILGAIGSDLNRIPDRISRWNTQRALRRASFTITVSRHLREQAISLGAPAAKKSEPS
jgi:teichuronic acid biosynthesis glycosyltransferase TuaC